MHEAYLRLVEGGEATCWTSEGAVYVIPEEYRVNGPGGWAHANLRTTLTKVIRRADVEPGPRLWHSLRTSCESDSAQTFPLAVVTKWLGNTPSVALRHYVGPTEAGFTLPQTWTPAKRSAVRGTESGTLAAQSAHGAAEHRAAPSRTDSETLPVKKDGEAGYASPCESMRDYASLLSGGAGN